MGLTPRRSPTDREVLVARSCSSSVGEHVAEHPRRRRYSPAVGNAATAATRAVRGAVVCGATAGAGAAPSPSGDVDLSEWWTTFTGAPWDEGPKPWKEFWAVKVAAAVFELDVAQETVSAKEVEGIGLNAPKDAEEALDRVKCNLIFYRQNYILAIYISAVLSNLLSPLVAIALLAGGGSAACSSDTLLGELSMLSKEKFVWNATRVAGFDREQTRTGLATLATVAFFCSIKSSVGSLLLTLVSGMAMVTVHAVLRPIDLRSTLSNLWKDVAKVQNRSEAEAVVKKGVKGIQSWWKNRRPSEPTPVVVSVKENPNSPRGYGNAGPGSQGTPWQAAAKANGGGAGGMGGKGGDFVDTTATVKPDSKGELPPGGK